MVRAAAYAELGIATVCRTTMQTDAVLAFLGLGETGMPSVIAPVPHVHDEASAPATVSAGADAPSAPAHIHAETRRA